MQIIYDSAKGVDKNVSSAAGEIGEIEALGGDCGGEVRAGGTHMACIWHDAEWMDATPLTVGAWPACCSGGLKDRATCTSDNYDLNTIFDCTVLCILANVDPPPTLISEPQHEIGHSQY